MAMIKLLLVVSGFVVLGCDSAAVIEGQVNYPYAKGPAWNPPSDNGLSLQSGFEGYLVPVEEEEGGLFRNIGILGLLAALFPPIAKFGLKIGFIAINFLSLLFLGSIATTAICTFTPLCTISFLGFPFRESVRSFVTPDRLQKVADIVRDAIDKYSAMQKEKSKKQ